MLVIVLMINSTDNDIVRRQQEFNNQYGIYALDVPQQISFAGKSIDLRQEEIRERFDRELLVNTYWQSQTLLLLKRKERWFSMIEPILRQHQVPEDFKYLAMAESGFTNTVSPSGATGFWQFLDGTGIHYGLEITDDVDERYHVQKATIAACKYLNESYSIFKDWNLVTASYNMGIDGVRKQMEKQKADNYFDLLLSEETSRYLFRVMALKEICSDPLKYGFHLRARDFYAPYNYVVITVDSSITDLADFAKTHGVSYKELKMLNPWLRSNTLSNPGHKKYEIFIFNNNHAQADNYEHDTTWIRTLPRKEFHQE